MVAVPPAQASSFKQAGRKLADDLRAVGIETIWVLTVPDKMKHGMVRPAYVPPEQRRPESPFEDQIFYHFGFDPSQIRPDEGLVVKTRNSCLYREGNPLLDTLLRGQNRASFVISGRETTRCITSSVRDGSTHHRIEHCHVIISHLADMYAETDKRKPPCWHQQQLAANPDIDQNKVSYAHAKAFLKAYAKKAAP